MRNKLLVSMAVLAAAIAVASCEKTPSEEPAGNQSGSATSEGRQSQSAPAQQRGTQSQSSRPNPATRSSIRPRRLTSPQPEETNSRAKKAIASRMRESPKIGIATPKTTRTGPTAAGASPAGKIAPAVLARVRLRATATL